MGAERERPRGIAPGGQFEQRAERQCSGDGGERFAVGGPAERFEEEGVERLPASPGPHEVVGDVRIDAAVDPQHYAEAGAAAMKLLVLYRPDEDPDGRVTMVQEFVRRCRAAGLVSIIEPVSRAPRAGGDFDWNAGVLAAARELGGLGADLYKAEVPHHGAGDETAVRRDCAAITEAVASPWVVLSSGVDADLFPRAVSLAIAEGASGFLAGRAVWKASLGAADRTQALRTDAVRRLQALIDTVDEAVAARAH